MFADQSRDALRASYREAWRKWRERVPMQPLEAQIADVVAEHPEYHPLLQSGASLQQEFPARGAAENPFLHMGLHLALREQLAVGESRCDRVFCRSRYNDRQSVLDIATCRPARKQRPQEFGSRPIS